LLVKFDKNTLTNETRRAMVLSNLITWLNGRRLATTLAKAPRARLGVDLLESREVPTVNFIHANGVLTIQGDDWHNQAVVKTVGNTPADLKVVVEVTSVQSLRQGETGTPEVRDFEAPAGEVQRLVFLGGDGNDQFTNLTAVQSTAEGGRGDDVLQGGSGNDILDGGEGNDTLRGGSGNDALYGWEGDDALYGDDGADRFLLRAGTKSHMKDFDPLKDAALYFANRDALHPLTEQWTSEGTQQKNWTSEEIKQVDAAFAILHTGTKGTNNTFFLKYLGTQEMTFVRTNAQGYSGMNYNDGTIELSDKTFDENKVVRVVLHEIGHNWDTENVKWNEFLGKSGWQKVAAASTPVPEGHTRNNELYGEIWQYQTNSAFASKYARTHPEEDFAESFTAYFLRDAAGKWTPTPQEGSVAVAAAKNDFIRSFVEGLKTPAT
jgi:hypothetical protein